MGAEKQEGMNESGDRLLLQKRILFPVFSSSFLLCLSQLGLRAALWMAWFDFRIRLTRWLHCKRGYHRLINCKHSLEAKGEKIETEYVRCILCEWCFFPSAEERRNYMAINGHKRDAYRNAIKRMGLV